MLVSQTAGGLYEHFFERVGKKAADGEVGPPVFEDHPDLRSTGGRGRARHRDINSHRIGSSRVNSTGCGQALSFPTRLLSTKEPARCNL